MKNRSVETSSSCTYDVIVIGLGAMGSAAAYQLSKRGQRVLGIEQFYPAHDKGSSHGSTRIIRRSSFEHPSYVPIAARSYEIWEELEQATSRKLVTNTGGFFIGAPDENYVKGSIESARTHGIEHEVLNAEELNRRFPQITARADQVAYYEPAMGVVKPEASIIAQQQLAQQNGADLHFGETVLEWSADADRDWVQVRTDEATYEARRLVFTIGAWAPHLLGNMELPIEIERHWLFWYEPKDGSLNEFRSGTFPLVNVIADDGVAFSSWPVFGSDRVMKATFIEGSAKLCTPETMNSEEVSPQEIKRMEHALRQYVFKGAGRLVSTGACMFTNTPDRNFVLSLHPEYSNISVATAMSGHGFKYSAAVGEILAELAINGSTKYDIKIFDPLRFRT
ncbi:MAG: N-methyl-L-tryptophan oxidase [Halomonas sp.]|uniref:N-methyl-L-tryptophan oxidase n=1 Tax=Halomonas sp. TaxID=1486246 RepID=UPI003F91575D